MYDLFKLIFFSSAIFFISLVISGHEVGEEFLLCKSCGFEVARIGDVFFHKSPHAYQTRNETELFGSMHHNHSSLLRTVTVQSVKNPHGAHFDILTLKNANLMHLNETKSISDTWFPNFEWTICVCPQCLTHLGWHFESVYDKSSRFFAVVVDKLFSENFADTLLIRPKLKMY